MSKYWQDRPGVSKYWQDRPTDGLGRRGEHGGEGVSKYWQDRPTNGQDPVPSNLEMCNRCRKVAGRFGGECGEECDCKKGVKAE